MDECRNCGAQEIQNLGFIGDVAPFFLKRVLHLEHGYAPSGHPVKRVLREMGIISKAFQKIYAKSVLVEMQLCHRCSFVQTRRPFPEHAIGNLYTDYRSDSYNRERIQYEPEYAAMAVHLGVSIQEVQARKIGLTQWLAARVSFDRNSSMLDYGGADGIFLPDIAGQKYVFDISDVAPADGVTRIKSESELNSYSYVQLAHVLEHVPFPLALTKKAASFLKNSGLLYVEVPHELSDDARTRLATRAETISLPIHEHINQYCPSSVVELFKSAGLSLVAIESELLDFGWNRGTIIRALGRKC